jgi:hypothetical protein
MRRSTIEILERLASRPLTVRDVALLSLSVGRDLRLDLSLSGLSASAGRRSCS